VSVSNYPFAVAVSALLAGVHAGAVRAQTITDGRVWWNVTVQERAGTKSPWRWYMETQGRHRDGTSDVDQMLLRPAVGYDLTSREWEVLNLLREGFSTAQIAEKLFVSRATVRSHVAAVLRKLELPDRDALRQLE